MIAEEGPVGGSRPTGPACDRPPRVSDGVRGAARSISTLLGEGGGLLAAAPLWVWWSTSGGGYAPTVWIPGLFYLAAATGVLTALGRRATLPKRAGVPLVALAALFLLTAASLAWADDRGAAWTEAERTALMLAAFALPVIWPPSLRALRTGVIVFVVAALAGLVVGVAGALGGGDAIIGGRLVAPTDYANATAALFGAAGLAALVLAAGPLERMPFRLTSLAVGGLLIAATLLTQSRGGLAAVIIAAAFALVIVPARAVLGVTLAAVAVGTAVISEPLLQVRTAALGGDAAAGVPEALAALVALMIGLALAGALVFARMRRFTSPTRAVGGRRFALGTAGALALVCALLVAAGGDPASWARDRFEEFKTADYERLEAGTTRLGGGLGSNRYDYWRTAVEIAGEHPATGLGGGNFGAAYLARRETDLEPLHAHGIWFESLAALGVPGALLVLAFVLGFAAAWRGRRGRAEMTAVRAAAVLPLIYLLVHGSIDWLWLFPGLTVPALGLAAAAISARGDHDAALAPSGVAPLRWAPVALVVLAAVAATPLFVSARLTERAIAGWHEDPGKALGDLRTARRIDPLSSAPALIAGIVAVQSRRTDEARRAFAEAADRATQDWFARFELGLLAARAGRTREALEWLAEAHRLNPREGVIVRARRAVERGDPPDPAEATAAVVRARAPRR